MGWKKALIYNLISGLTCYLGAIVGIFAATTNTARQFLFALTGGLFLYIALVDLVSFYRQDVFDDFIDYSNHKSYSD